MIHDGREGIEHGLTRGSAEHGLREGKRDLIARGRKLIEQGDRIAHPARRLTSNLNERIIVGLKVLGFDDHLRLVTISSTGTRRNS